MLEIDNVSASYGEGVSIQNLSIHVAPGEVVGLLGRNGAGKTSALSSILGQLKILSGEINFEGGSLKSRAPHEIPPLGIGIVPQGNKIFPNLSVLENLLAGHQRIPSHDRRLAHVLKSNPQVRAHLHQRAGTLSGGEQQLVALARAQLMNAKLMLLDEPAEGLMPSSISDVEKWVGEMSENGVGVLWAEQRLDLAMRLCDRIYVLDRGRLVLEGPPNAIGEAHLKRHLGIRVE